MYIVTTHKVVEADIRREGKLLCSTKQASYGVVYGLGYHCLVISEHVHIHIIDIDQHSSSIQQV